MRKKNFSRKLHSILSITLSLVMLIGACFAVPATTAMAEGETITIDFENNNYGSGGSGLLGPVATTGPDGEATTAFKIMGHNTDIGHYRSKAIKDANDQQYTLTSGDWQMTYDYIVPAETSVKAYLIYDFGIKTGVLCEDGGIYCSGAKVMDENLIASYDTGVWKSNTINFTVDQDKSCLGFAGIGLAPEVYIDNVVFTKLADKEPEVTIGPYAEEHDAFTTYGNYKNGMGSKDTMDANNAQISGNAFNYRNTLFSNAWVEDNSVLAVALWTGARHMRLNDTAQGLALRAGKTYSLTFKWLNPNPENDGVVGNESINKGTSAYDEGAYISLIANAGAFNGTSYSTLATLLNVNDFSSAEGNTGEFVTKTVTFTTPDGADITDIAISTKSSDGPSADTSKLNQNWIFLDDIQFVDVSNIGDVVVEVSFNTNGGDTIESVSGLSGTDIIVSDPVKFGYKFTGWFEDADCTVPSDMKFAEDVTVLYAGWTEAEILIDFEGTMKDGSGVFGTADTSSIGGTGTAVYTAYDTSSYDGNSRYAKYTKNGVAYTIPAGKYVITYDYYYHSETVDEATDAWTPDFYFAKDVTSGTSGSAIKTTRDLVNFGVDPENTWLKGSVYVEFDSDCNNFGFAAYQLRHRVYIDNVEFIRFDDIEEQTSDVAGYDMFKNDSGLKLEDTAGTIMENNSVIYKKADGSERTAFRFVSSYDYYTDGTNQYLDAEKTIKIVKRGMLFGKVEGETYTQLSSSEKDATAEAWSDNGSTIEYTFKVFNISYANKDVEYYVTPYLIVDVGGKELTITGDTASNSIQGIYNNSTAAQNNYTWYTQQ